MHTFGVCLKQRGLLSRRFRTRRTGYSGMKILWGCGREIYSGFEQDSIHRDELIKCFEDRWLQCEQPQLMLGYGLHPKHVDEARKLPDTDVSGIGKLPKIAVYYYRRLFATEEGGILRSDMLKWMEGTFARAKATEFADSPWEYWRYVAKEKPNSLLPKLAMVVLSIAVSTATCERLFSELGMIHTAKSNRMLPSNALDIHTVAKHVRQRPLKDFARDPRKKLLIRPDEREIVREALGIIFTPSPESTHAVTNAEEDSEGEDPGDRVDGAATFSLWGAYLDEVFQDEEIDTGYIAADYDSLSASNEREEGEENDNEFEAIPAAFICAFPDRNVPNVPQEGKLKGFRGQKATIGELFLRCRLW